MNMKRPLIVLLAALALLVAAPTAWATGWYDENGYHHADEPGDVCYEHGGAVGTDKIDIGVEVHDGITLIQQQLVVICGDGTRHAVGDPTFVLAAGYDPGPPPPPPSDEAWQDNPCYPPERDT